MEVVCLPHSPSSSQMQTLVSHFVNHLSPSVRFVKHYSFFFIILEVPNTALQQLNTPLEKLVSIILRGQGLVIEILVLELAVDVVTNKMALSVMSVHEHHLLQVIAQIFIQKGVDVEVLPFFKGVCLPHSPSSSQTQTLVSHFVNHLSPSVRFVKHYSFFFIILEVPNTALQQLNTPLEKLVSIILRGQGLVIEILVLELAIDVVTNRMALSVMSVHEHHLLQVIAQIFIQKGVDVEVLPPSESVWSSCALTNLRRMTSVLSSFKRGTPQMETSSNSSFRSFFSSSMEFFSESETLLLFGSAGTVYPEGTHFLIPWFKRPVIYDIRARPHLVESTSGSRDLQMYMFEQYFLEVQQSNILVEWYCSSKTRGG
ncbi:Prohibitin-1, mitochondrial [Glycine soja]